MCLKVEHPVYWTVKEWCEGFKKLIDHLELDKIHLFGASLGKWAYRIKLLLLGYKSQEKARFTYF